MFIGAHEAEYMFVTTLLKIEQHLLAQGRCPYKLFRRCVSPNCVGADAVLSATGIAV